MYLGIASFVPICLCPGGRDTIVLLERVRREKKVVAGFSMELENKDPSRRFSNGMAKEQPKVCAIEKEKQNLHFHLQGYMYEKKGGLLFLFDLYLMTRNRFLYGSSWYSSLLYANE